MHFDFTSLLVATISHNILSAIPCKLRCFEGKLPLIHLTLHLSGLLIRYLVHTPSHELGWSLVEAELQA